jgi:hypothetical protein
LAFLGRALLLRRGVPPTKAASEVELEKCALPVEGMIDGQDHLKPLPVTDDIRECVYGRCGLWPHYRFEDGRPSLTGRFRSSGSIAVSTSLAALFSPIPIMTRVTKTSRRMPHMM